jgi:hypothetical protein
MFFLGGKYNTERSLSVAALPKWTKIADKIGHFQVVALIFFPGLL